MIITGKTIFKLVYILSIIFSVTYIVWNALQHNPLDPTYLLVGRHQYRSDDFSFYKN